MSKSEALWAPWRIGYILAHKEGACFMCEAVVAEPSQDEELLVLERGRTCFVVMNRYPYANGHLLIAPNVHQGDFTALDDDVLMELGTLTRRWVGIIKTVMRPEGFNLGYNLGKAGGAGFADHLHEHIVPRWLGDSQFMSTCADTRILNQSLAEGWRLLREAARA